eukprot:TRINITY_DN11952_c0_g1_i1.p1 TRINITY_DN11952_c0_g1~~TRINITY_DN11952_c0_g1_i1.p1  ORF type:complete len:203 (-),score=59.67 TRINITY_DN11952_c0_g1_i1:7-615(-)
MEESTTPSPWKSGIDSLLEYAEELGLSSSDPLDTLDLKSETLLAKTDEIGDVMLKVETLLKQIEDAMLFEEFRETSAVDTLEKKEKLVDSLTHHLQMVLEDGRVLANRFQSFFTSTHDNELPIESEKRKLFVENLFMVSNLVGRFSEWTDLLSGGIGSRKAWEALLQSQHPRGNEQSMFEAISRIQKYGEMLLAVRKKMESV